MKLSQNIEKKTAIPRLRCLIFAFLAFIIPYGIIILSYIALHITPFGEHTILFSDAKALYTSDLSYIARVLRGQEDFIYSFKSGIGMNLMGANSGLLNPANIIVLLFDITSFPSMYSLLMAIDIAMCGLTMFLFLSAVYGCKGKNLIFSTVYAMMGFNVAYCFQYNFILSPELLPLIALGIIWILKGKSPWLYILSLGYSVFASFYFGFMLCIASVVLFLFWYVRDWESLKVIKGKIWFNYVVSSIVAGLMSAVGWIPALLSFSGGRLNQTSFLDFAFKENMSLADACAKFFIGSNNISQQINGMPNIFVGSLALFLNFAFFTDRHNSIRKRIIYILPLLFYFLTFYINAFSMVVQGFSETNWFNYRYSFVFSFLMILIAYEEFSQIRDMGIPDLKRAFIIFFLFVVIVFTQRYSFVSAGGMLLGMLFLCVNMGVIWWNRKDPQRAPTNLMIILVVLICSLESYANYLICTGNLKEWDTEKSVYQNELFLGSVFTESIRNADPSFFRIASEYSTNQYASNDPRLFGYNGLVSFGSCEKSFVLQGMSKLGMSRWDNRMWYSEGKPNIFDSFFGVKYVISKRKLEEEKGYKKLVEIEGRCLYSNPNVLPIAMVAASDEGEQSLGLNPFENHNTLWKSLTGREDNIFDQQKDISFTYHAGMDGVSIDYKKSKEYSSSVSAQGMSASVEKSDKSTSKDKDESLIVRDVDTICQSNHVECTFKADYDGPLYAYTGLAVDEDTGFMGEAMYYLGTFHKGDIVTDYIPLNGSANKGALNMLCAEYYVACPNQKVLEQYSKKLQDEAGAFEKIKDSHLVGHVETEVDGRLFFTIPFDEGWTLTVDGVRTPLKKTADLFMSAELQAGSHDYELTFSPRGMKVGIMVSAGALVLFFLLIVYNILMRKKHVGLISKEKLEIVNCKMCDCDKGDD